MRKIKLLTPILGLTAIASAMMPLASCSSKKEETGTTVPSDAFEVKDVTLKGFKEDYDFSKYEKLVIPSNVKVIDTNAFKGLFVKDCKIKTVVIPGNVETIRQGAFANNPGITTYDFSGFDVDSIHALTVESGVCGDLSSNGIYSYVKMNDNWTQVQKDTLKLKLLDAGVPSYWFVTPSSESKVELASAQKEQTANGGIGINEFKITGEYTYNLRYAAILTKVDGTEGVNIESTPEIEVSGDFKSIKIPAKMIAENEHKLQNEDWVTYKISIVCYTEKTTSNGETTQTGKWVQTIETFKLTYHNIVKSISVEKIKKSEYKSEEKFDPTGLEIEALYTNGDTKTVKWGDENLSTNLEGYTFTVADVTNPPKALAYYKSEDVVYEAEIQIKMLDSLNSIGFEQKTKLTWNVGDKFDPTQIAVYGISDKGEQTETIYYGEEGLTVTPEAGYVFTKDDIGTKTVTVSLELDGKTRSNSYEIKIEEASGFEKLAWREIGKIASLIEAMGPRVEPGMLQKLCVMLKIKYIDEIDPTITDPYKQIEAHLANLIGLTHDITLNGIQHKVRVIGICHDLIYDTKKPAAFTFELVDLMSDSNGNALKTGWNPDPNDPTQGLSNFDYFNTAIYKNLTGSGTATGEFIWEESASDIFKHDNQELFNYIKLVEKEVAINPTEEIGSEYYEVSKYQALLFNLTAYEMNETNKWILEEGTPYKYWVDHSDNRTKYDVNGNPLEYWLSTPRVTPYRKRLNQASYVAKDGQVLVGNTHYEDAMSFGFCI